MLKGISASPGIALGKVLVLKREALLVERRSVPSCDLEIARFQASVALAKEGLIRVRDHAFKTLGKDKAEIFEAHLLVLEDPELIDGAVDKIKGELVNAEFAFQELISQFVGMFEAMKNEYMRARAADIKDVGARVLRLLLGKSVIDLAVLKDEVILVSDDLTPSETAMMDKEKVLGFLTDTGGKTSHTAIMARTLEIPAVVGLKNATDVIRDGDFIILDGSTGQVFLHPTAETIERFRAQKAVQDKNRRDLRSMVGLESVTLDGRKIRLEGNIGTPENIPALQNNDAEGVGLLRTEFIYMDRDTMPSEEEQFQAYRAVLAGMSPRPAIIRTLDIGGDKALSYLKFPKEANPFLGCRAIRFCLKEKPVFRVQLRALLRASVHGKLGIMFPMISNLDEILAAKAFLAEIKGELDGEGIRYSSEIQVGIMIEIPAAAILSDVLAKHVDFFSIGTNDLIQYTCAVDRMNPEIGDLYDPFHPSVLRLIQLTIENGHRAGIPVGMCGEMAGTPEFLPLLLGMGLDDFSMSPAAILGARKQVRGLRYEDTQVLARKTLTLGTGQEVAAELKKFNQE